MDLFFCVAGSSALLQLYGRLLSNPFAFVQSRDSVHSLASQAVGMQLRAILLLVALMAIHAATLMFSDGPRSYHSI